MNKTEVPTYKFTITLDDNTVVVLYNTSLIAVINHIKKHYKKRDIVNYSQVECSN